MILRAGEGGGTVMDRSLEGGWRAFGTSLLAFGPANVHCSTFNPSAPRIATHMAWAPRRQMFIVRHSTPLRQESQPTWHGPLAGKCSLFDIQPLCAKNRNPHGMGPSPASTSLLAFGTSLLAFGASPIPLPGGILHVLETISKATVKTGRRIEATRCYSSVKSRQLQLRHLGIWPLADRCWNLASADSGYQMCLLPEISL
jgi:hypothetical protein